VKKIKITKNEKEIIENFLDFLQDKIEENYNKETKQAIENFMCETFES